MDIDHRRPLVAYVLVLLVGAVVLAQGMAPQLRDLGPGPAVRALVDTSMTPSERLGAMVDWNTMKQSPLDYEVLQAGSNPMGVIDAMVGQSPWDAPAEAASTATVGATTISSVGVEDGAGDGSQDSASTREHRHPAGRRPARPGLHRSRARPRIRPRPRVGQPRRYPGHRWRRVRASAGRPRSRPGHGQRQPDPALLRRRPRRRAPLRPRPACTRCRRQHAGNAGPGPRQGPEGRQAGEGPQGPEGRQAGQGPEGSPKDPKADKPDKGPKAPQGPEGRQAGQGPEGTEGPEGRQAGQGPEGTEGPEGRQAGQAGQGPEGPEGGDKPEKSHGKSKGQEKAKPTGWTKKGPR